MTRLQTLLLLSMFLLSSCSSTPKTMQELYSGSYPEFSQAPLAAYVARVNRPEFDAWHRQLLSQQTRAAVPTAPLGIYKVDHVIKEKMYLDMKATDGGYDNWIKRLRKQFPGGIDPASPSLKSSFKSIKGSYASMQKTTNLIIERPDGTTYTPDGDGPGAGKKEIVNKGAPGCAGHQDTGLAESASFARVLDFEIIKGSCQDGLLQGPVEYFGGSSNMISLTKATFNRGVPQGDYVQVIYLNASKGSRHLSWMAEFSNIVNGIKTGHSATFNVRPGKSKIVTTRYYQNGKIEGHVNTYMGNEPSSSEFYSNGQLHGRKTVYSNGQPILLYDYKNGKLWLEQTKDYKGNWTQKYHKNGQTSSFNPNKYSNARDANNAAQSASSNRGGNSGMGIFMGVAAGLAGKSAGMSSSQATKFGGSAAADVISNNGGKNMRASQNSYASNSGSGLPNRKKKQAAASRKTFSYNYTCPGRNQNQHVNIPYKSQSCLAVLKKFTRAYSCNMTGAMKQIRGECTRVCGTPTCFEK